MQQLAWFSFYGNLNDFLLKKDRHQRITYSFKGIPAVKDAIEAIGVPHVEVEWILINGIPSFFFSPLQPGDTVEVYPQDTPPARSPAPRVRDKSLTPRRFVLDNHLGALARLLRMLGIDTTYNPTDTDQQLARISSEDHRVILTRDIPLLKQKIITWGYWLRSQHPPEQLLEVIKRYDLSPFFRPFTRCHSCNSLIQPIEKASVSEQLPTGIREFYNEFFRCTGCGKVYWQGTHYERMEQFIRELMEKL